MSYSWLCNSNVADTKGKVASVNILCSVQQRNSRYFSCNRFVCFIFMPHQCQIQPNELYPTCRLLYPTHLVHIIHLHLLLQRNFQKSQTRQLSNYLQRQMRSGSVVNSPIGLHQKLERNSWRAGLCLVRSVQAVGAMVFLLSGLRRLEVSLIHERCVRGWPSASFAWRSLQECVICGKAFTTEVDWAGRETLVPYVIKTGGSSGICYESHANLWLDRLVTQPTSGAKTPDTLLHGPPQKKPRLLSPLDPQPVCLVLDPSKGLIWPSPTEYADHKCRQQWGGNYNLYCPAQACRLT